MYNNTDFAQAAVRETKGWKIGGNKIKVNNVSYWYDFHACMYVFMSFNNFIFSYLFVKGGFCKSRESDGILPIYAGIWSRH